MTELHNARLADGSVVDVLVDDNGNIAQVRPVDERPVDAVADHDLDRWLVLPAFAEPHAHLDKALTAELVPNPAGDLMGAIEAWTVAAGAGKLTDHDTTLRAGDALDRLLVRGVTAVRSHVNVGDGVGVGPLQAVQRAVEQRRGAIDVQLVALMHSPLTGVDGAGHRRALTTAIDAGVDVIGGCPHLEPDPETMIDLVLDVASEAGLPIDLHVDETLDPNMRTLPMLARAVIDRGFELGVTASHCVSLGMQSPADQAATAALVAEAGIAVVALPQTNLFLQGRDHPSATPRGLTAVHALRAAGVVVSAGMDNVQDPFNLMGRSDPLETAALMVMAGHVLPDDALAMVSTEVRRHLGLAPHSIEPGAPADLVAIDAVSVRAAIAEAPMSRRTFTGGALVAESSEVATVHRSPLRSLG